MNDLNPYVEARREWNDRYLDLVPVCARGAEKLNKTAMVIADDSEDPPYLSASTWVLLTSNPAWFQSPSFAKADMTPAFALPKFRTWTDDYSNVFQILKFD